MTTDRDERVSEIFSEVDGLPEAERAGALRRLCGDDEDLRAEVRSLLAAAGAEEPTTLSRPGAGDTPRAAPGHPTADPLLGRTIGKYSIKSVIASGGMGTVYVAVQEQPHRKVALKLMKRGIASRSALRRFEFEAQVLGRLRHPNVAQIHEAGTHDDGGGAVPFFAMEYIAGARTISEYAQEKALGTRERLALFGKVCDAVHHGHQKGIIHRDLKPGNILVDATGEPKIIDFGVARATDSDLAVTTLQTDLGQLIGTLQYMSPEQCAADPEDIDTRSDVYALGVVLYEMLTGRVPYDVSRAVLAEAARVIREEPPARPSTLDRTLRGDVETITLKALEKDRDRRYRSAEALADDVRRYLRTEPIQARRPSAAYQLNRFARRHKPLVIGAAAVLVVLVAGIAGTSLALARALAAEDLASRRLTQAEEAEAEVTQRAEELEQVAAFQASQLGGIDVPLMATRLREDVLTEARAAWERAKIDAQEIEQRAGRLETLLAGTNFTDVTLSALDENVFEGALAAVDEQFADQPLVRARLLQTLAITLADLGLLDRATAPQTEALEIRRRELGDEHPDTLASIGRMGTLLIRRGRLTQATPYLYDALEGHRRVLGNEHQDTVRVINNIGFLLTNQGKLTEAEPYYREALEIQRRVWGEEHADTLSAVNNMGTLLWQQGKLAEAEEYFRGVLEGNRRVLGDGHPRTLMGIANLGYVLLARGKRIEAEECYREALEKQRLLLGDDHPDTLRSIGNMGSLLVQQGRLTEATPYMHEALVGARRVLGDEHPQSLGALNNMGYVLRAQGKLADAESYYREALRGLRRVVGDEHPNTLASIRNLATVLNALGRYAESESLLRKSLPVSGRVLGDDDWRTAEAVSLLGEALTGLERYVDAEGHLLEGHAGLQASLPATRRGKMLPAAVERLIRLYSAWGKPEQAAAWRATLEGNGGADLPPADGDSDRGQDREAGEGTRGSS